VDFLLESLERGEMSTGPSGRYPPRARGWTPMPSLLFCCPAGRPYERDAGPTNEMPSHPSALRAAASAMYGQKKQHTAYSGAWGVDGGRGPAAGRAIGWPQRAATH